MPVARPLRRPSPLAGFQATIRAALLGTALLGAGLIAAPAARAQAPEPIAIELNRLESRPEGCRVWMLVRNPGAAADPLRLDLVIFGKDGVVGRRLALDLGPLPAAKTMARIFDLAGTPCDGLGHVLLNDVLACGPDSPAACLARLAVSSRANGVALEK
ncbi:Tat pathway signal protein [Roseomonas sp. WA12]